MQPWWRLAINSFSRRPGRAVLTVAAVALGVALVVAVGAGYDSARATILDFIDSFAGSADILVLGSSQSFLDARQLDEIRKIPGVRAAGGHLHSACYIAAGQYDSAENGQSRPDDAPKAYDPSSWVFARLIGSDATAGIRFENYTLAAGRALRADDRRAVVLDERIARRLGVKKARSDRAVDAAYTAYREFQAKLIEMGREALRILDETGEPGIVLVGRTYNVYDRGINCDIPRKLRHHYGVNVIPYDFLVIATGTRIHPEETEGLLDGGGWRKEIFDFYTIEGTTALANFFKYWEGGRLVLNVVEMPIKCPVAPLEFVFLADWWFTEQGIRPLRVVGPKDQLAPAVFFDRNPHRVLRAPSQCLPSRTDCHRELVPLFFPLW